MRRRIVPVLVVLLLVPVSPGPASARPRYLPDTTLAATPGYDAVLATSPGGTTLAVWASGPPGERRVTFARHRPGRAWTAPVPLAAGLLDDDVPQLDLVMSASGRATAVWVRNDGAGGVVTTASWTDPTGWTTSRDLSLPGADARYVDLDLAPSGLVTATWSEDRLVTRSKRLDAAVWGPPRAVPDSVTSQTATVATDPTGRQVMTWLQWDGAAPDPDDERVRTSTRRSAEADWSPPTYLVPSAQSTTGAVVVRSTEGVLAVWRNDTLGSLEARVKASGRAWSAVRSVGTGPVGVYADSDRSGRVTVVHERADGLLVSRRYAGGAWSPPDLVATGVDTFRTALDVAASGRAAVQFRTTDAGTWTAYRLRESFGTPHQLGTSPPGQVQADGVGVDEQGNVVALWNTAAGALTASVLDAGRPTTAITALRLARRTGATTVRWRGVDRWSAITAATLEVRSTRPRGGFGPWRSWPRPYTREPAVARATLDPTRRHCVRVRVTDATGTASPFATRCTPRRR